MWIERPFNFLDIESASRYYELSLRQPVFQTPSKEFALGLTASRRESKASFEAVMKELASPPELMKRDVPAYQRCSFSDWTQRNSRSYCDLSLVLNRCVQCHDQ